MIRRGKKLFKDLLWTKVGAESKRQKGGADTKIYVGITDKNITAAVANKDDFLYIDHAYFNRGWDKGNFRLVRSACHMNHVVNRPDDRLKKWGIEIQPWRKSGRNVVIIPSTFDQHRVFDESKDWMNRIENEVRRFTSRPVLIKDNRKFGLSEYLKDAWAVVSWASNAAIEATLMGVPSFCTEWSAAWPVNAGRLEDLDSPQYAENRHEWACSLAYASWHIDEIPTIKLDDYQYSCRDDLPSGGV